MSKKWGLLITVIVAIIVIALLGVLFSSPQTNPLATEHRETIVKGVITVSPASYKAFPFYVPSGVANVHVEGSFTTSGGIGNDIQVIIMDSTAFQNWKNGHEVSVYYTSGKLTTSSFDVSLPSGETYYLVLDNAFSLISSKNVDIEATLVYRS